MLPPPITTPLGPWSYSDRPPLASIGAHLLPQAGTAWMQWLYARPARLPVAFEAAIAQIDLAYRAGGLKEGEHLGPVHFEFRIDGDGSLAERLGDQDGRG